MKRFIARFGLIAVAIAIALPVGQAFAASPPDGPASIYRSTIMSYAQDRCTNPDCYYVLGGNGPLAFDCSGLTSYSWKIGPYWDSSAERPSTYHYYYNTSGMMELVCYDIPGVSTNIYSQCLEGDALVRRDSEGGHIFVFRYRNSDGSIQSWEARSPDLDLGTWSRTYSYCVSNGYKAIRRSNVVVPNYPGSISMVAPTTPSVHVRGAGVLTIQASASDANGISYVQFSKTGPLASDTTQRWYTKDYSSPYTWDLDTDKDKQAEGEYLYGGLVADVLGYKTYTTSSTDAHVYVERNDRVAGSDRYATAIEVSKRLYPSPVARAQNVVLVRGDTYADAMAAASFARIKNAALLYTRTDYLPSNVKSEITRLQPKYLYVIGGTSAISDSIARTAMYAAGLTTYYRRAGATRYETAVAMWEYCGSDRDTVVLINYTDVADAMSVAAAASAKRYPVLLTTRDTLPTVTHDVIADPLVTKVYIVGGTSVVSDAVKSACSAHKPTVRIYGADRYATAVALAKSFLLDRHNPYFVNGSTDSWPDAFAGGVLAGKGYDPILLTYTSSLPSATKAELQEHDDHLGTITLLGGTAVTKGYTWAY